MSKCNKKFDELNDKTESLEDAVKSLKALTSEIIRRQRIPSQEPQVVSKHG